MWNETSGGKEFEQAPVGTEVARCIKIIDLGTQKNEFQGEVKFKAQTLISWELPNALMTDGEHAGKPFIVSKFYTTSLHEKSTLRHDLAAWRGRDFTAEELKGFDPKNILGKPCMLSLVKAESGKTKVASVMAVMKGMEVPEQTSQSVFFSMYPGRFTQAVFDGLSEGIKKIIMQSPEYKQCVSPEPEQHSKQSSGFDDLESDVPYF